MKAFWTSLALLTGLAAVAVADVERRFYVAPAPRGNDENAGTKTEPFATFEKARLAVREHRASHPAQGEIVVEAQGGWYELSKPLRFDARDSGEKGKEIVYRAAPGERVALSGGKRIVGWRREGEGVFAADVGSAVDFRQLWIGSHRGIRARRPNAGEYFRMATDKQADGFDLPRETLQDVRLRPGEVEIAVSIVWMHKRLRIARVDSDSNSATVRAVIEAPEWDAVTKQPQGDRVYVGRSYWLENAPEFLDAPGEFYLDRASGVLRYRPRPGENLEQAEVIRPVTEQLIVLEGTFDAPVHDLRFEGFSFEHTGWTRPNQSGFVDVQANSLIPAEPARAVDPQYRHNQRKDRVPAAFQAITADRIVVRECHFTHLGGTGVMFTGGGNDNVIEGNSFYDLAAGGIEMGEDAVAPANDRLFPRRNRIANNFLAHIGEDYWGSVAILGYYTDELEVSHNEITAIPYTAISLGWGWGTPRAPAASRANRILYNRINNYMRRLDDGGGIYTTDRMLGSEIAHNVITRMLPPDPNTKAGGALYLDQFTEGVRVHHNLIIGAVRWLNIWNPNIRGNQVEANEADTAALRNDGTDNVVEPARLLDHASAQRQALRAGAGLEPAFEEARVYSSAQEVIVDNGGVDFHLEGAWEKIASPGSYTGVVSRAATRDAVARIWPVISRAGTYEVSIRPSAVSNGASIVVEHAAGQTVFASSDLGRASEQNAPWVALGRFPFEAGARGEIVLRSSGENTAAPLIFDAIQLVRVAD